MIVDWPEKNKRRLRGTFVKSLQEESQICNLVNKVPASEADGQGFNSPSV